MSSTNSYKLGEQLCRLEIATSKLPRRTCGRSQAMLHIPCDPSPPEIFVLYFIIFRTYHFLFVCFLLFFFHRCFLLFWCVFLLSLCFLSCAPFAKLVFLRFSFFIFFSCSHFLYLPFSMFWEIPLWMLISHFFLDLSFCKKKIVFKRNMTYFLTLPLLQSILMFHQLFCFSSFSFKKPPKKQKKSVLLINLSFFFFWKN